MDFDSSSKFIASLARFLQSLCNGYVEFDKGVEVIGHIYLSVDSDTGRKIDYVLNEKVCKNDNSVTFISNSFHAQPAEKPQPVPKKPETDNRNEDSGVIDESGQSVPNNVNIRTTDSSRDSPLSSNKRPRSPLQCRMGIGRGSLGPVAKSPRYQDQTGTQVKFSHHTDVSTNNVMNSSEDYDGSYGEDEDSFLNQDYSNLEIDQKPVIEPDVSIVKEEYMASQQGGASYSNSQPTGPGRGRPPSSSQASFPTHHNSTFTSSNYSASSLMSHDPPNDSWWNPSRFQVLIEPLQCQKCQKKFTFPQALTRHRWKCESSRKIYCTMCSRVFYRRDHYKKHVLAKHNVVL